MTPRYGVFGNFLNELLGAFLLPPLLQAVMDLFRLICCKDGSNLLGIGGTTSRKPRAHVLHDAQTMCWPDQHQYLRGPRSRIAEAVDHPTGNQDKVPTGPRTVRSSTRNSISPS